MGKKDVELIDPDNVQSKFLAECLAVTAQYVSKLAAEGVLTTNGRRGKYRLREAIPAYIKSIRKGGHADAAARLKTQQERKLRIQNEREEGRLVAVEDAAEAFRTYCLTWRAGIAALPRRLATQLSNESNPAKIQKALTDEFAELFEEMEVGLREYFASAGETFSITDAGANSEGPPAKKNARPVGRRKKNTSTRKRGTGKVAK